MYLLFLCFLAALWRNKEWIRSQSYFVSFITNYVHFIIIIFYTTKLNITNCDLQYHIIIIIIITRQRWSLIQTPRWFLEVVQGVPSAAIIGYQTFSRFPFTVTTRFGL